MHYDAQKQKLRETKFKPRIKLNHNVTILFLYLDMHYQFKTTQLVKEI